MRPSKGFWRQATSLQNCKKCSDNLVPEHRKPAETYRKKATICDGDNPLLILTNRQLFTVCYFDSDMTDQPGRRDSKSSVGVTISCTNKDIKSLRDGQLEITEGGGGGGGGGGEKFSVHEFFLKPTCLQDFFPQAQALHGFFFPHISSFVTNLRLTLIRTWRINCIPPFCRNQKDYYPEYPDTLKHGIEGQLTYYKTKEYLPFLNIIYIFCYFVYRYCFGNNNVSFWWKLPLHN